MGLRFFRRVKLWPGFWLNLSLKGVSVSVGMRGLRATFGRGRTRLTAGLPGTGLSVTHMAKASRREPSGAGAGRKLLDKALKGD